MVEVRPDPSLEIARLEARVARLEKLLAERSRQMRDLIAELRPDDLVSLSRVASGLSPLLTDWRETTALTSGQVDRTMEQLWRSLARRTGEE